jgi:hypothetical protein
VNCHKTGAVSVDHDEMATNHARTIRAQGNQSCAYCHLPVSCARCHEKPVLPVTTPLSHPTGEEGVIDTGSPPGVLFPLSPGG